MLKSINFDKNTNLLINSSLWLKDKNFDLIFFHLSGIFALLLLTFYLWKGDAVIFPIYNFYLIFFGIPHNYLTWATLLPEQARKTFNMKPIYAAAIVCFIIVLLLPFTEGTTLNDWILSLISYISLWHAYRQHHGICKIYDTIQSKRFNDKTIYADRFYLNLFFPLALYSILLWVFTHENVQYFLSLDEKYNLIYPVIPKNIFYTYCAVTAVIGIIGLKKAIYDRNKQGRHIPWPQLSLMLIAILTYIVPYFFIPVTAMPLAVAIGTIFHNVQYFGFVWLFEKYRTKEMNEANISITFYQKLVSKNAWIKYFSIALTYSIMMIIFYLITPKHVGMTLIYFMALSHYIIDGYMWKKDINKTLSPVLHRISIAKGEN
nr:hypothetical protein GTC16762_10710 [Pigmentibacter ruber]